MHLESDLGAAPGAAALGPAFFAGAAAAGRLAGQGLVARVGEAALLVGGALVAAAGTLGAALAPSTALTVVGIAVAGAGSSVCAPVLISLAGRAAAPGARASAVSVVTTIAYLGFLVGPAVVGLAAAAIGLPAALAAVAGLAVALAPRRARRGAGQPDRRDSQLKPRTASDHADHRPHADDGERAEVVGQARAGDHRRR